MVSFPKRRAQNLGVFLRFWFEAEVNFFRREKLCRRDYLDYLKNRAKSGDMAVLQLTFRNVSLGKWSKNWGCYRRHAHSFFVCLSIWVCVVCVSFLLYLYVYMSFARCVFRVLFHIHDHLFQFQNVRLHPYCCTHNIVLIIQLYLFSVLFQVIFIKIVSTLICTHVTVSIDVYKHRLAYMTLLNIIKMNNEI